MWFRRSVTASVFLLIQLAIVTDVLNRRATDPGVAVDWIKVFAVLIVYLAIALIFIVSTFYAAGAEWLDARALSLTDTRSEGAPQYSVASSKMLAAAASRRNAWIYFYDGAIDTLLYTTLVIFLVLIIDKLTLLDEGSAAPSWGVVFIPFFVFLVLLLVIAVWLGLRVYAEKRYERALNNSDCCGAACGDVVICCAVDRNSLDTARSLRSDKRINYEANAAYHGLPCAFMCTPSLTYGAFDTLLAWAWIFLLVAVLVTTIMVVVRLDSASGVAPTLIDSFVILIVAFGLLALLSIILIVVLLCWYRRRASRPLGRQPIHYKYAELLTTVVASALFIAQLAVLAHAVDDPNPDTDWNVVFIPLYIFLALVICVGCCCYTYNRPKPTVVALDDNDTMFDEDSPSRRAPTSMYGVFNAVAE